MSTKSEDEGSGTLPAPPPLSPETRSFDRTLVLATLALALTAGLLLGAVLVIESGFEQLRREAFPLPSSEEAPPPALRESEQPLPANDQGEPTAFLGIDLQHPLSSGLLSVYLDDRLVHEAPLSGRLRRRFLFRAAPQGELGLSLPVEPGLRRIALRIRSDELPAEAAAQTSAEFTENQWRLLMARLRLPDPVLETRWSQ